MEDLMVPFSHVSNLAVEYDKKEVSKKFVSVKDFQASFVTMNITKSESNTYVDKKLQ